VTSAKQEAESYAKPGRFRPGQRSFRARWATRLRWSRRPRVRRRASTRSMPSTSWPPAVTRQRLYIETMERVLRNTKKVIVDSHGATAPIILPPDAFRPKSADQPRACPTRSGSRPIEPHPLAGPRRHRTRLADRGGQHFSMWSSRPSRRSCCAWADPRPRGQRHAGRWAWIEDEGAVRRGAWSSSTS